MVFIEHIIETSSIMIWNEMFHNIIKKCSLEKYITCNSLPDCFNKGHSCGHIYHIALNKAMLNTLHLTILEIIQSLQGHAYWRKDATSFIYCVVKRNPMCDLGLQLLSVQNDYDQMFVNMKEKAKKYKKTMYLFIFNTIQRMA